MDAGCYCAHSLRFFPGCSRPKVCCCSCVQAPTTGACLHSACIAWCAVLYHLHQHAQHVHSTKHGMHTMHTMHSMRSMPSMPNMHTMHNASILLVPCHTYWPIVAATLHSHTHSSWTCLRPACTFFG